MIDQNFWKLLASSDGKLAYLKWRGIFPELKHWGNCVDGYLWYFLGDLCEIPAEEVQRIAEVSFEGPVRPNDIEIHRSPLHQRTSQYLLRLRNDRLRLPTSAHQYNGECKSGNAHVIPHFSPPHS